jgi:flagellar biosynthesis/type III secretory pathway protein FliH
MSFVSRRIATPPECPVPITRTVLRRADRDALGEATDYAKAVRREADALIARARDEAAALHEQTSLECRRRRRSADAALLERAIELEAAYRTCRDALAARLETTLDAALAVAIKRLAATLPPAQRMKICADALRECAGTGATGRLFVSPDDAMALGDDTASIGLPWAVQPDASLPRGHCRLEVGSGAWQIEWASIVERFLDRG